MRRAMLILLLLFLAGCSTEQWNAKMSTPEERALALQAANAIGANDYKAFDAVIDPPLRDEVTPESFAKLKPMVPKGQMALQTVSVQSNSMDGVTTTLKSFNYEVGSGDKWAIVQITLRTSQKPVVVMGYRVWPADRSPLAANNLDQAALGPLHYVWLVGMTLALGLTLTALVFVIRTRGLKRKWLWAIGCLFSFVSFQLNWTTGAWGILPISFLMFGAGATNAGPLTPWVMQFAIPVVAIIFLIRRASGAYDPDPDEAAEPFA